MGKADAGYSYAYFMRNMLLVFLFFGCFYGCFFLATYFSIVMVAGTT